MTSGVIWKGFFEEVGFDIGAEEERQLREAENTVQAGTHQAGYSQRHEHVLAYFSEQTGWSRVEDSGRCVGRESWEQVEQRGDVRRGHGWQVKSREECETLGWAVLAPSTLHLGLPLPLRCYNSP